MPAERALPADFGVALDPGVRALDDGTVLVGGSPLRLLRLTEAGRRLVERLATGERVPRSDGGQRLTRRLLDAGLAHPRPGPGAHRLEDVTIVIPVRDRTDDLVATLANVGPAAAVVVVDDGSTTAATGDAARARGATVLRHERSRGPGAARNTGWRQAMTPLVAFVDADCEPAPGWLDALIAHFDDPAVAAVAPRITTTVTDGLPRAVAVYERARPALDRGPQEAIVRPRSRVPFVPTAALVVRHEALAAMDGFDESMPVGEDVDLVWRLAAAGWTVRYEPASTVAHPARATFAAWLRQRFDYGTSAATLATRHGSAVAPLAVSPWTAASWGLVGVGAPVAGTAVAAVTTALLAPRLRALRHPWQEALRIAGAGHLYAGRAVADAVRRVWWPLAAVAAVFSRRARVGVAAAVTIPPLLEWLTERPAIDPVRWTALRVVDDVTYGAGVWVGCWRERSAAALRPDLTSWPGHRDAVELSPQNQRF
ncbi:MAG: mycofactocin glycosyltransferase [Acidimicrobiaceae bacterium]